MMTVRPEIYVCVMRASTKCDLHLGNEIALRDLLVNLLGSCRISCQLIIYSGMRNSLLQEQINSCQHAGAVLYSGLHIHRTIDSQRLNVQFN